MKRQEFLHLERFDKMPDGWKEDGSFGSPVTGYIPICNGKNMIYAGKKGLLKDNKLSHYLERMA